MAALSPWLCPHPMCGTSVMAGPREGACWLPGAEPGAGAPKQLCGQRDGDTIIKGLVKGSFAELEFLQHRGPHLWDTLEVMASLCGPLCPLSMQPFHIPTSLVA